MRTDVSTREQREPRSWELPGGAQAGECPVPTRHSQAAQRERICAVEEHTLPHVSDYGGFFLLKKKKKLVLIEG